MRDLDRLYKKSAVQKMRILADVKKGSGKNVAGKDLVELSVKYKTPPKQAAGDYNGILLMAVEFFDRMSGEKCFAFAEHRVTWAGYAMGAYYSASMFIDASSHPDAVITGWAAVYGHLLPDGVTVAVLDSVGNAQKSDDLAALFVRNRHTAKLDVNVISSLDPKSSSPDKGVIEEQGILDVIGDYIPGI
jgi:hypothetical protein